MSKLIYAPSLAALKIAYPTWQQPTSEIYRSIGYTADGYLYTHGHVFRMAVDETDNPWGLSVSLTKQSLGVTVSGYTSTVELPIIDMLTTATDDLSVTKAGGVYTVKHKDKFPNVVSQGPTVASNTTINVPRIAVSETGHVTTLSNAVATLNNVKMTADTTSTNAYMLFGVGAGTSDTLFNTSLKANLASGTLYATKFYEDGVSMDGKYAPIMHANAANTYGLGTGSVYGHVKLSDAINSSLSVSGGVAATPNAVLTALDAAKAYAKELLGTTDAMLFVGTVNGTGVIQSHNTVVIPDGVTDGTTNISSLSKYSAGWTFKVIAAGTITGIGKVESGDMLIASSDFVTSYKATDWSVIQANLDGAVTITSNLVNNALVLGASATTVKSLANGTAGQYLMINASGTPVWTSVGSALRAIKYNGLDFLASSTVTALDLIEGAGITLSGNSTTGVLTITNKGVLDTFALTIYNGPTDSVLKYQPKTAEASIKFDGGLKAVATPTTVTVTHNTSSPTKATGLYQFSVDAYGHIVAGASVTSLPNAGALTFANASDVTVDSYLGDVAKTLKFANGTDISFSTISATNKITITPSITHRYRGISYQSTGQPTATVLYGDTTPGIVTFKAGTNVNITNTAGVLTFTATDNNTWRNVKAIVAGTTLTTEVLSTSIGVADLEFGSDFLWTETGLNGKLQIGWAEIDATGNVTYVV